MYLSEVYQFSVLLDDLFRKVQIIVNLDQFTGVWWILYRPNPLSSLTLHCLQRVVRYFQSPLLDLIIERLVRLNSAHKNSVSKTVPNMRVEWTVDTHKGKRLDEANDA